MGEGENMVEATESPVSKTFLEDHSDARDLRWIRVRTVECVLDMLEERCDRAGCTASMTGYDAWGQWCDEHAGSAGL